MRTIRTFILRLMVDPAEPTVLRGALQSVPDETTYPFIGGRGLLALLQRLSHVTDRTSTETPFSIAEKPD